MEVIADASCNILYASFYLKGIQEHTKYVLKFRNQPFKGLRHENQYLALIFKGTEEKKVIIDFGNFDKIYNDALDWADVYGKVNLNPKDKDKPKVVGIGPLTAINVFGPLPAAWLAITNLCKSYSRIPNKKLFLSYYKSQLNRPKLSDYTANPSPGNYVFFIASLWKKEKNLNDIRANFIRACQKVEKINFEGGFAPRKNNDIPGYEHLTLKSRVTNAEFLEKTYDSLFVFNAPSVGGCNGWRLAEYLIMGKAILSTPLVRLMPGNFVTNQQFLLTDGTEEDMQRQINYLVSNPQLLSDLQKNAKKYYLEELSPGKVIERIEKRLMITTVS